ncbi:MAG TPA: LysR substrate-binding domain-containing protein [Trebonia sp.]|nr:LysR substrate-binding domain-containing protein [Trebonia sp.]
MQLQQLAYFVAVAEARHFTRAADHAQVAQPSLSQQIRALERELGAPLFHRTRGNVSLTDAGEALLPVARRMLADAETARLQVRAVLSLGRGRVRLGATPSLCTALLPPVLAGFRREHPGIELLVHESGSRGLQQDLTEGGLDLALVVDARLGEDSQVVTVPLFTEDLVVISSPAAPGPAGHRTRMTIQELEGKPLVMFRPGYDLRETTEAACREAGFSPAFAIEGGEMDAVLAFVRAGLGLAVVPHSVAGDQFRVTSLAPAGLTRTILLARRRGVSLPHAAQALAAALGAYVRGPGAPAPGPR